jgi:mono/diheme cytochrome c family protein
VQDFRFRLAVVLIALFIFIPAISLAGDDAAILYKTKCAVCHGADGLANTPMGKKQSIPSFASDKVQKSSNADIQDFILNGGKEKKASHAFAGKGITGEDATKLATYIKELGKKK